MIWKINGATCDVVLGNLTMVKWLKEEQFDVAVVDFFFGDCGLALAYHTLGLGWVSRLNHNCFQLKILFVRAICGLVPHLSLTNIDNCGICISTQGNV